MFSFFYSAFSQTSSSISSKSRYMPRILRKYASTPYKFLDIGISHVQIAIDDNQGNCMFIPHAM
ncbi:hypothetical protein ALC56_05547 [Trachymyrmex septentrionalis]|uniref:Uncharacterized protein n=1 Tax=Trachymyrmex septentrionalis TaxID=34720 RepID=A0A151JXP3_9HYME|nr:hypothetical protein ALC56_05547 [Trachymyrmex septentrionalis]